MQKNCDRKTIVFRQADAKSQMLKNGVTLLLNKKKKKKDHRCKEEDGNRGPE